MKKSLLALIIGGGILLLGIVFILIAVGMGVSFYNKDVQKFQDVTFTQTDNKNQMDGMWKTIDQVAQVAEKDRTTLSSIFKDYAEARTGSGGDKPLMNWIKEAVPNVQVNSDTFKQLMNIIVNQREQFKNRQTALLDKNRDRNAFLQTFPNNIFAMILGRKPIDVTIVTSTRTENAFKTGKDDDTKLFSQPAQPETPTK